MKMSSMETRQKNYRMSMIKSTNSKLELEVFNRLNTLGYFYEKHKKDLPGCPDIVFPSQRIVVFIDSDFWHGWNFIKWKKKLKKYWVIKIEKNIKRDRKNRIILKKAGWKVFRIWEHQWKKDKEKCIEKLRLAFNLKKYED